MKIRLPLQSQGWLVWMDKILKNLKGSSKRDMFKWAHKNKTNRTFYASDCDLCIVSFRPRGVVAYFDYKGSGECVTSTETVLYDEWSKTKPVFIVEGSDPENGPFIIHRYIPGSNEYKKICDLKDWNEFDNWEESVRKEYKIKDKP